MKSTRRLQMIIEVVKELGYASVSDLSAQLGVSDMTIRRDLDKLTENGQIQRTYGGAVLRHPSKSRHIEDGDQSANDTIGILTCQSDVLIAASYLPKYGLHVYRDGKKADVPVISESFPLPNTVGCITIDNYEAGTTIGRWAGQYVLDHFGGPAHVLDLTHHFSNTLERSKGFSDGLREVVEVGNILSLNPQTRYEIAYQLTRDALSVDERINVIFSVNDLNAWGAINACRDLEIDPEKMIVIPFGLEGNTLKNALRDGIYCKGALAMFPELVGPVCVEAAVQAFNHSPLPEKILTPYTVLDKENLPEFYYCDKDGWHFRWDETIQKFDVPYLKQSDIPEKKLTPDCIGVILPFFEHEWYQNMVSSMRSYAKKYGAFIEIVDVEQTEKDEIDLRQREIANRAVKEINPGDVIFLEGGAITKYMVAMLAHFDNLTVITNSLPIFIALKEFPNIILISTGGVLRRNSEALVGPIAENSLKDLRSDKLFLTVSGISLDFGLSHTNVSEVTIKQTMIQSAREVILLADNTSFGQEAFVQIAPVKAVHKIITDDALLASTRLQLSQLGIEVLIASL